jgi:hypothetical protein
MNIFNELKKYATGYELVNSRGFNDVELSQFASAKVVASEYGMSVCFYMVSGGKTYIPVSRDSICNIGDTVDASKAKILTLEKDGKTINRIEI